MSSSPMSPGPRPSSPITPCLWFDDDLEEAVRFWTGIFPSAEISSLNRAADGTPALG